jgi:hypothetical protein
MTRAEVKKQIADGWLTTKVAMTFMSFDLDATAFKTCVENTYVGSMKNNDGTLLYKLGDVLASTDLSAKQLVDKYWPVRVPRKDARKQTVKALTKTGNALFLHEWHRLHDQVSDLIARKEEDFTHRELKLFHQLMSLSYKLKTSELILTSKQLEKASCLDNEYLPKARRSLERRDILITTPNGNTGMVFTLLNPRTKRAFDADVFAIAPDIPIIPAPGWGEFTD